MNSTYSAYQIFTALMSEALNAMLANGWDWARYSEVITNADGLEIFVSAYAHNNGTFEYTVYAECQNAPLTVGTINRAASVLAMFDTPAFLAIA